MARRPSEPPRPPVEEASGIARPDDEAPGDPDAEGKVPAGQGAGLAVVDDSSGTMAGAGDASTDGAAEGGEDDGWLRELIRRARQGERPALDRLMAYYRPRLRAWAAARLRGTPHDPSSMTQEVLTRLFRGLPAFEADSPRALNAWLWTTLGRLIASAERERTAQKRGGEGSARRSPPPDESPTPSRHLRERQGRRRLQQLISRLPQDQSLALWRRHIEDWSVAEIAAVMGRTGPQVSSLLWRAQQTLGAQVQDGEAVLPDEEERLAPQIDRAMAAYAERLDQGEALDGAGRERFLTAHEECAAVLRRILDWEDRLAAWSREPG